MSGETTPRKMLRILDLLEEADGPISAEVMLDKLAFTRSTLYRHLKILTETGFIASIPEAGFTLGPRIAELDYRMRRSDPLIRAARPVMTELAQSERGAALLCRRYRNRVLCIHQERSDPTFRSHYERGLARPIFRGATSRIILAHLHTATINRLQAQYSEGFAAAGLGESAAKVRETLRRIRQQGWDITQGQVTPGVTGIAAPLFDLHGEVLGSLSLTVATPELGEADRQRLIERITFCAGIIRGAVGQM
jgi:DNA-binding IclR family transcriptional regulator